MKIKWQQKIIIAKMEMIYSKLLNLKLIILYYYIIFKY